MNSPQCPIVLLRWRQSSTIVRAVAPCNLYLGIMLPYTPLHHILLRDVDRPLVMTSGNLSEEPIAQYNDEARQRLGALADGFLLHNREIHARYDDSVVLPATTPLHACDNPSLRLPLPSSQPLRRSRGYAPFPIRLPFQARQILATGAELKNTFCLTRDDFAFLSQHIGDMENMETLEHFEASMALLQHLFRVEPEIVAHDLHPDYFASKYARARASDFRCLVPIQHHHAHIAACLVDNDIRPDDAPVIGVAWDGTGYGSDGRIWGGEVFVGGYRGFCRKAHLEYLPMPGGDAAVIHPWRLALGYVYTLTGSLPPLPGVTPQEVDIVRQQVDRGFNTPLTSAAGRLFDAVAALVGVRHHVTYEAQAAIEWEMLATRWGASQTGAVQEAVYPFALEDGPQGIVIRLAQLFDAIQAGLRAGTDPGEIGWRFHCTVATMIASVCQQIASENGLDRVALSGGCFQNRLLLTLAVSQLQAAGFRVLVHQQVPCNDGGISLGQAALAHFAAMGQEGVS